jgi:hypothetical protein
MAFGDEFLDVECDLGEHLGNDACAQGGGDECAGTHSRPYRARWGQEREHDGEGQGAAAGEEPGRETIGIKKFLRIQ